MRVSFDSSLACYLAHGRGVDELSELAGCYVVRNLRSSELELCRICCMVVTISRYYLGSNPISTWFVNLLYAHPMVD